MSIYHFKYENYGQIHKDYKWISNFKDMEDLFDYTNSIRDMELIKSIDLVKKYGSKLFKLLKVAERLYKSKKFDIYLTNAHISKGLEWNEVYLYDDFPDLYELKDKLDEAINKNNKKDIDKHEKALQGEVNLYYVALTRAKERVIDKTDNEKWYREFKGARKSS